jgi:nucleoid DNA-binding protein
MATAKKPVTTTTKSAKTAKSATKAAKRPAKAVKAAKSAVKPPANAPTPITKPIKTAFNKSSLLAHIAGAAGQELKAVKAMFAALEATVIQSVNKKGLGEFTLPGLLKVSAIHVPAKKARKGINPFTKQETVFKAKPATVKVKVRPLKKLKNAAL